MSGPAEPSPASNTGRFSAPPNGYAAPESASTEPSPAPPADGAARADAEGAAAPAPASAPISARSERAYEPAPQKKADDRPGLGTTWGETRTSYVSSAPFNRADAYHPFALVSLNYNDEAGVRAAAQRAGVRDVDIGYGGVDADDGGISVRVLGEGGSAFASAHLGGRDYIVGSDGERYVIQIENHTGFRFEAVATVDGLDVIDGKGGSLSKRGYLINPRSTLEIDGFRQSQAAVAAFRFGSVKDSYAARKGSARNVGVIGVAFFHEEGSDWRWLGPELERRESANAFPGGFAAPPPSNLAR